MRTVNVKVVVNLVIKADEDIEIGEIMDELEYNFTDTTTKAEVEDSEMVDYHVTNSR